MTTVLVEELVAGLHQNDDMEQLSSENEKPKPKSGDGKKDLKGEAKEEPSAEGDGSGSSTKIISKHIVVLTVKVIRSFFPALKTCSMVFFLLFLFYKALRNLCFDCICDRDQSLAFLDSKRSI